MKGTRRKAQGAGLKMSDFKPGDIVRHKQSAEGVLVTANYGNFAIAVRTTHISNPSEWEMIQKGSS